MRWREVKMRLRKCYADVQVVSLIVHARMRWQETKMRRRKQKWGSGSQFSRLCTHEVKWGQNEAEKTPSAEVQVISLVVHARMRWERSKWGWESAISQIQVVSLVVLEPQNVKNLVIHAHIRWIAVGLAGTLLRVCIFYARLHELFPVLCLNPRIYSTLRHWFMREVDASRRIYKG